MPTRRTPSKCDCAIQISQSYRRLVRCVWLHPAPSALWCAALLVLPLAIATAHSAARIDRLQGVREVVQAAAVIGREFTLELLAGVTRLSEQPLLDALAKLNEVRLMCRSSSAVSESYAFNHMLIREIAYSMLLHDHRRLHQRVAEVLRERFREQGDVAPELLAHHYALAGLIEPAVRSGCWPAGARFVSAQILSSSTQCRQAHPCVSR